MKINEIEGIKIKPLSEIAIQSRTKKKSKYYRLLEKLPPNMAFMIPPKKVQTIYTIARKSGLKVKIIKQETGLFAVFKK